MITAFFRDDAPDKRFKSNSHDFPNVAALLATLEKHDKGVVVLRFDGDEEFLSFDEGLGAANAKVVEGVELVGGTKQVWGVASHWPDGSGWRVMLVRRLCVSQAAVAAAQAEAQRQARAASLVMAGGTNGRKA